MYGSGAPGMVSITTPATLVVDGRYRVETKHAVFHRFGSPGLPSSFQERGGYIFRIGVGTTDGDKEKIEGKEDQETSNDDTDYLGCVSRVERG